MKITLKCTYDNETFYQELVDLVSTFPDIHTEGYDMNYSDHKKKGYLKCKSAFSARKDPFVGVWIDDIPTKGFYSEANECTIDKIKDYLCELYEKC